MARRSIWCFLSAATRSSAVRFSCRSSTSATAFATAAWIFARRLRERPRAGLLPHNELGRGGNGLIRGATEREHESCDGHRRHDQSAAPSGAHPSYQLGSNTLSETKPIRRGISSSRTESRALRVRSRRVISSRHHAQAAMCARISRRSSRLGLTQNVGLRSTASQLMHPLRHSPERELFQEVEGGVAGGI